MARTRQQVAGWLKEQKWFGRFVKNMHFNGCKAIFNRDLVRGFKMEDTITKAFNWEMTPEGGEFWGKVNVVFLHWFKGGEDDG